MYIVLNKSYKGLILCLTGLSDKYKSQQATRIINKHSQRNITKPKDKTLTILHFSHLGSTKTILRARTSVFWPGLNADIKEFFKLSIVKSVI